MKPTLIQFTTTMVAYKFCMIHKFFNFLKSKIVSILFKLTRLVFNCAFWLWFRKTDDFKFCVRGIGFNFEFLILVRHNVVQFLSSRDGFTVFENFAFVNDRNIHEWRTTQPTHKDLCIFLMQIFFKCWTHENVNRTNEPRKNKGMRASLNKNNLSSTLYKFEFIFIFVLTSNCFWIISDWKFKIENFKKPYLVKKKKNFEKSTCCLLCSREC